MEAMVPNRSRVVLRTIPHYAGDTTMTYRKAFYLVCAIALVSGAILFAQTKSPGYTDTAILPGQNWHVHD